MIPVFFSAIKYFTRIPIPDKWCKYSPEVMQKITVFLPLIGVIVGLFTYAVFYLLIQLFNPNISSVLTIMATILITGAFHHDGLADVADGFGGGWNKEQVLRIMKDSSTGAYGAIAVCLSILLLYTLILSFPIDKLFLAIVFSAVISRSFSTTTVFFGDYARSDDSSRASEIAKKMSFVEFCLSLTPVFILVFINWRVMIAIIASFIVWLFMFLYFKKRIGGYTGDCLGAIQQITELVSLLTLFALWQ